jgi:hypothetical protein
LLRLVEEEAVTENEIGTSIVDAAYRIHIGVGPGCLESAHGILLKHELERRDIEWRLRFRSR